MEALKIIAACLAAAIGYGIIHDQVTAHLCVEYFSVAHPPVFPTQSPFWLAIGWGIIATWWVGLPLGVLLAAVSQLGPLPRLPLASVRGIILALLAVMALSALLAGATGAALAAAGAIALPPVLAAAIPAAHHFAFMADAWAHRASYAVGVIGGLAAIGFAWRRRRMAATAVPKTGPRQARRRPPPALPPCGRNSRGRC